MGDESERMQRNRVRGALSGLYLQSAEESFEGALNGSNLYAATLNNRTRRVSADCQEPQEEIKNKMLKKHRRKTMTRNALAA